MVCDRQSSFFQQQQLLSHCNREGISTYPSKILIHIYRAFSRFCDQLLYKQIGILRHTAVLLLDRFFRERRRQNAPQASVVRSVSTENTVYVLGVALSKGCSLAAKIRLMYLYARSAKASQHILL